MFSKEDYDEEILEKLSEFFEGYDIPEDMLLELAEHIFALCE